MSVTHTSVNNPDPGLINDDIRPTTAEERHWSVMNMASLWVGMVVCVPTYTLAAGLISEGMNWWQAVLTIMVGNVVVLLPMVLNGHAGTRYGVPFPVLARASFGIKGAHVPSLLRALVACGWFGIQTWFGGFAIYQLINALFAKVSTTLTGAQLLDWGRSDLVADAYAAVPGAAALIEEADWSALVALQPSLSGSYMLGVLEGARMPFFGINPWELACFILFWLIQIAVIYRGVESIRLLETVAAPLLIGIGLVLLAWAYVKSGQVADEMVALGFMEFEGRGGFGSMWMMEGEFGPGGDKAGQFMGTFIPSLTAMVGFWATLSLNIPDFTRYASSQRDQILGQAIGLPTTMTLFAFISVAVTAATTVIFANPETGALAEPVWDPTVLAGMIGGGATIVVSLFMLAVATLSTNIAANVVSPANALINFAPQRFTFQMGGYITAAIGFAIMPWKLIESTGGYIFVWLVGYSALLGPIVGILIADYFVLRRTNLDIEGLYRHQGPYTYQGGFNPAALVAFGVAVLPNIPGFLHKAGAVGDGVVPPVFDTIYTYAWFVGFGIAAAIYLAMMRASSTETSS